VHREHSLASGLRLDGSSVGGKVLRVPIGNPNSLTGGRPVVQNGHSLTATSLRPFIFSTLELTGILFHTTRNFR